MILLENLHVTVFAGFTGQTCEDEIDECQLLDEPCLNGGNCSDLINGFMCRCPPGYDGQSCELLRPCQLMPCTNGATCSEVMGNFTCHCPDGYTGVTCDTDIDECNETSPCSSLATCINIPGGFECLCPPSLHWSLLLTSNK